eukprot:CAMPEP_0170466206 /NCGR_PEP_ID=MMETSP0123-20130129/10253_1 /TAXON_ID=182087 /ORGANISM="Favella ehrenbergii, Strain Fehren 1" /LENGTH=262 /DNA_ID=CAMNT_0010732277 /DNA_START=683 /DNA_END=1470 /DNA_ORIENTATION=+
MELYGGPTGRSAYLCSLNRQGTGRQAPEDSISSALWSPFESAGSATFNIVRLVQLADLSTLHPGEVAKTSGVRLGSIDVLCVEIAHTSDLFAKSGGFGTSNHPVLPVEGRSFSLAAELAEAAIHDDVGGVERIGLPLGRPALARNISIANVVRHLLPRADPHIGLLLLCALDVENVKGVARGELFLLQGPRTLNVIDLHGVADETWHLRRHHCEASQFVDWVQRVRWLTLGYELYDVSLGAIDVFVRQVVLRLVESDVEHAW